MTTLQEYDLEIKPTKIVCMQGLWNLVVEAKDIKDEYQDQKEEEYIDWDK